MLHMNPEILKKCLSGTATPAEMAAYDRWLAGEEEEIATPAPAEEGRRERMWEQITTENHRLDHRAGIRKIVVQWAVAASILLVCLVAAFAGKSRFSQQELAFSNQSNSPLPRKTFDGLHVRLGGQSEVSMHHTGNNMAIDFAGSLLLSNPASEDRPTIVSYTKNDGCKASKKLLLRKGKTYLLAYYPYGNGEVIVVENRSLMDMPPALAQHIKKDFTHFN
ncbi:hypothetical protein [Chitinophaga nivalis]|uniref:FecR protein domain-containing protein n=1 Tax=Chitinophaga nivalis TaxID=2991709 RepID=A0ABT3IM71_9BACT|nr:hypothetical protein [Chitinophaga nivalis]MCW3465307.1 hypothetical protein [Chitinophaga nivalis]MCW3485001.1 hypothetical protein [Chitinophaga nivalis]